MSSVKNPLCPCGSKENYESCCEIYHKGATAPTAEKLMRSRYSAFAKEEINYLVQTHHPETRPEGLFEELSEYAQNAQFLELKIVSSDDTTVNFIAVIMHHGEVFEQRENSLFENLNKRLYYKSAL